MKYTLETSINLPREQVIALFDNAENLKLWQPCLLSFEHLSGEAGQVGATSKIIHQMGKKEVEMTETITLRNFPEAFACTYEANGIFNLVENHFEATSHNLTTWTLHNTFQCKGFMRIMAFLMPWAFKKETRKFMQQFKGFAELKTKS